MKHVVLLGDSIFDNKAYVGNGPDVIYPRMPEPEMQRLSVTALTVFNDCIIRTAVTAGLPLLDLRLICNEDADYANPIEPSVQGGDKISSAIMRLLCEHDFRKRRTEIFV